jgi:hypothetical protein
LTNPTEALRVKAAADQAHADYMDAVSKVYSGRFNLEAAIKLSENIKPTYFDMFSRRQPALNQAKENIAAIEKQLWSGARPVMAAPKMTTKKGGKPEATLSYYLAAQQQESPRQEVSTPTATPRK